jgi:hypothetical protein
MPLDQEAGLPERERDFGAVMLSPEEPRLY